MWLIVSGCGMFSVGIVTPQCGWHVHRRCAYVLSLCVYGLSRCGNASVCCMASVGVTMPQCVWHGLSGCGLASVGVA